ncbi:MAG TPA: ABC transporter substrate-binding protein [Candidatus Bathyarchaeia archaeon]|nr:ABC transporter substrate-binding protein [Candidatus Bathyarchaeia archaeon]
MQNLKRTLLLLSLASMLTFSLMLPSLVEAQQQPLFKVTLIAPGNANLVRRQWGQIFANSLQQLGIDARVVFLGWTAVFDRVFTPPLDIVGKTWDQGGFDIQLVGWTPGLLPEPRQGYYGGDPGFFAPTGQNYLLWNNSRSNDLLDTFITSTNVTIQEQSLQEWQSVYFEDVPASQIFYDERPALITPEVKGYDWIYFNAQINPEFLYTNETSPKTRLVFASTGEIESLIPPLSNSWYDTIITSPIFGGLVQVNNEREFIPALLTDWNHSADNVKWTLNLRPGVKWHDDYDFTADDVVFSLWALMNANTGSQFVGYFQSVFGDSVDFKWENTTTTTLGSGTRKGTINATSTYRVDFSLPELTGGKPFGYIYPYLLAFGNNIIPYHIFSNIPTADWTSSVFNTGEGSTVVPGVGTYYGPVGTGPYKWIEFDSTAQLVHLQKFDQYWNKTALENEGRYEVVDYYIRFIADKTAAIAALKNNEVDMLDPNYQMHTEVITPGTIDSSWATIFNLEGAGRQEIGYNMRHPIFGTGVDTPLGKATPSRAAEAARYVRQAFDYAVPRQLIIDNLLSGFGDPGVTPMLPTQPYYNASITSRPYDLTKARELLQKAGYTVPGPPLPPTLPEFILGMSTVVSGYFPKTGTPLASRELQLMEAKNNATYNSTSLMIGQTTTDLAGWYSFTVTPTATGVFYYYLFDRQASAGGEWTYLRSLNVSSVSDLFAPFNEDIVDLTDEVGDLTDQVGALQGSVQTLTYVAAIAIVIAVVIGFINFWMMRKRP